MKIHGDAAYQITTGTDPRVDRASDSSSSPARTPEGLGGVDHVEVSPDARLAQSALQTVAGLPDIRPDVVARMQALLNRGELGADPHRLADALIDAQVTG